MRSACPKFRNDLVVREVAHGGSRHYLVKDPVSRRFFRFRETEHFIVSQLDGSIGLDDIAARFEKRFGVALPVDRLETFLSRLEELGLTEQDPGNGSRRARRRRRGAGGILYLKLGAVNPDRLFTALAARVRFLFTPYFVLAAIALTIAALAVIATSFGDYADQAERLLRIGAIPSAVLAIALVVLLHESAHGLTCAAFGGHVSEMGFLLFYFLPGFFCNVSDAWLFPERKRRIWVSFAGTFIQIFVWAASTLLWRVIDTETWFSDFLVLVMADSGITALFNLNPLIKLDGYYMLVDWLEIPNLRRKAFAYVWSRL